MGRRVAARKRCPAGFLLYPGSKMADDSAQPKKLNPKQEAFVLG
jgi:hypothetical protein